MLRKPLQWRGSHTSASSSPSSTPSGDAQQRLAKGRAAADRRRANQRKGIRRAAMLLVFMAVFVLVLHWGGAQVVPADPYLDTMASKLRKMQKMGTEHWIRMDEELRDWPPPPPPSRGEAHVALIMPYVEDDAPTGGIHAHLMGAADARAALSDVVGPLLRFERSLCFRREDGSPNDGRPPPPHAMELGQIVVFGVLVVNAPSTHLEKWLNLLHIATVDHPSQKTHDAHTWKGTSGRWRSFMVHVDDLHDLLRANPATSTTFPLTRPSPDKRANHSHCFHGLLTIVSRDEERTTQKEASEWGNMEVHEMVEAGLHTPHGARGHHFLVLPSMLRPSRAAYTIPYYRQTEDLRGADASFTSTPTRGKTGAAASLNTHVVEQRYSPDGFVAELLRTAYTRNRGRVAAVQSVVLQPRRSSGGGHLLARVDWADALDIDEDLHKLQVIDHGAFIGGTFTQHRQLHNYISRRWSGLDARDQRALWPEPVDVVSSFATLFFRPLHNITGGFRPSSELNRAPLPVLLADMENTSFLLASRAVDVGGWDWSLRVQRAYPLWEVWSSSAVAVLIPPHSIISSQAHHRITDSPKRRKKRQLKAQQLQQQQDGEAGTAANENMPATASELRRKSLRWRIFMSLTKPQYALIDGFGWSMLPVVSALQRRRFGVVQQQRFKPRSSEAWRAQQRQDREDAPTYWSRMQIEAPRGGELLPVWPPTMEYLTDFPCRCCGLGQEAMGYVRPLMERYAIFASHGRKTCDKPGSELLRMAYEGSRHDFFTPYLLLERSTVSDLAERNVGEEKLDEAKLIQTSDLWHAAFFLRAHIQFLHVRASSYSRYKGIHRGRRVGRSLSEFTSVSSRWIRSIRREVKELWVTSSFFRTMYERMGVAAQRVHVLPEAVDVYTFDPSRAEPFNLPLPLVVSVETPHNLGNYYKPRGGVVGGGRFIFMSSFKWEPRKGWDILLKAYWRAFGPGAAPHLRHCTTLIIKTTFRARYAHAWNGRTAKDELHAWSLQNLPGYTTLGDLPHIIIIADGISSDELTRLYATADAFVLPTRGEGWGLPIAEAMSMGLPVIVPHWSGIAGLTEFNRTTNNKVGGDEHRTRRHPRRDEAYMLPIPLDGLEEVTSEYGPEEGKKWSLPSEKGTARLMRFAVEHPLMMKEFGARARSVMIRHFSEEAVADLMDQSLARLLLEP